MGVPLDPTVTPQGQGVDPNATLSSTSSAQIPGATGATGALTIDLNLTAGTMGQLAKLPGGQDIMNLIEQGIELQIYNDMKRQQALLLADEKQHRQDDAAA